MHPWLPVVHAILFEGVHSSSALLAHCFPAQAAVVIAVSLDNGIDMAALCRWDRLSNSYILPSGSAFTEQSFDAGTCVWAVPAGAAGAYQRAVYEGRLPAGSFSPQRL